MPGRNELLSGVEEEQEEQEGQDQEGDGERYEIEVIVQYRAVAFFDPPDAGYKVKWKGYDESNNSWVRPGDALDLNAGDLIDAWWEQAGMQNPHAHLMVSQNSAQPLSGVATPTLDVHQIQAANKMFLSQYPEVPPRVLYGQRLRAAVGALQNFVLSNSQPEAETRLYHYSQLLKLEMGLYADFRTAEILLNDRLYQAMKTQLTPALDIANFGKGTAAIKEAVVNLPSSSDVPEEAWPLSESPLGDLCWWTMLDVNRQVTRSMVVAVELSRHVTYIPKAKLLELDGA